MLLEIRSLGSSKIDNLVTHKTMTVTEWRTRICSSCNPAHALFACALSRRSTLGQDPVGL
jgi:hypothetical protein